jgi:hypothetical protein
MDVVANNAPAYQQAVAIARTGQCPGIRASLPDGCMLRITIERVNMHTQPEGVVWLDQPNEWQER